MKTGKLLRKPLCLFLCTVLFLTGIAPYAFASGSETARYPYIFVAGYAGYGQYDKINNTIPYWGMASGDLLKYLNSQGFECYAASVDPVGSAWDRACELYAQLTGTVVDYGQVHAARYGHARFGTDYSANPLITGWGDTVKKINLMGHSYGGTTIRVMADLLANGCAEEIAGTAQGTVSGLFTGGKAALINSITTLSSPHNGSTVSDPLRFLKSIVTWGDKPIVGDLSPTSIGAIDYAINFCKLFYNGIGEDTGLYGITLDGAAALNAHLSPLANVYYFSFATDATKPLLFSDYRVPDKRAAAFIFLPTCLYMGCLTGTTPGGIKFDKQWYNNDGVVNTFSCLAPFKEAKTTFNPADIHPGIWNIMPVFKGDHASIIGGAITPVDVRDFYVKQMTMIDSL